MKTYDKNPHLKILTNTKVMTFFKMAYKHDAEHDVAKNVKILTGFYVNTECFSLKICLKKIMIFETMSHILKPITITFVITNYEVEFLFLCRDVIFNEILGISNHIFLSVIFS